MAIKKSGLIFFFLQILTIIEIIKIGVTLYTIYRTSVIEIPAIGY